MEKINFEKAKEIAATKASEYGKVVKRILENQEYWKFEAEFPDGHQDIDDGIGSIYISKKDGTIKALDLWNIDFTSDFNESASLIYDSEEKH